MESNPWKVAFFVTASFSALIGFEALAIRAEVRRLESTYSAFVASKLKNGKTIGQMIRPGSVGVFEYEGVTVICSRAN